MSKLEELIQKLCPNGVEYKLFNEVAKYIRGVTYGKGQEITDNTDGYNLLRANNITLSSNTLNFEEVKKISFSVKVKPSQMLLKNDILICAGSGSKEHIGKVAFIFEDIDYTFGGFMGVIRVNENILLPRFMFHILTSNIFKEHLYRVSGASSSTINNINNDTWKRFIIPLPPLEIQQEIVRILDNFTEITAELTARKKQYEYYRDELLTFGEDVPRVELKNVCRDIIVPMRDRPKIFDGNIPWCRIEDKEGKYFNKSLSGLGVSEEIIKKMNLKIFPTGTVICSCSASLGAYAINTQPLITNQTFIGLVCGEQIHNKFLLYYMETQTAYLKSQASTGTIPYVSRKKFEEMMIPLPPLAEQERIVSILDRFDALCNDISSGLPAEIEARQKQYEYYRDKLLQFVMRN